MPSDSIQLNLTDFTWEANYNVGGEPDGEPIQLLAGNTGLPWHVQAIRVQYEEEKEGGSYTGAMIQEPYSEEIRSEFDGLQMVYEGAYETVEIPGFPGEWVIYAVPFAD